MSKQKKYHYIYKTTCTVTGKFYIGMHSTDNLEDGYLGSGKILGYSRHKYGDENHVREILEMLPSREALKAREKEIVNEQLLSDPLNINLKYGGDGGGRLWNEEHAKVFHQAGWNAMQAVVDKSKRSRNAGNTIRQRISDGTLTIIGGFTGKKHSEETKQKMRKPKNVGEANSQFGTCWVTNGTPIKIKKEQLDEYLLKGYRRGRKYAGMVFNG